jgi:hypothetical protein
MSIIMPAECAVADWARIELDERDTRRVRNGMAIEAAGVSGERARAHSPDGALVALLSRDGEAWKPDKVFDWS